MAALLSPRMLLLHVFAIAALTGTAWLGAWQVGAWQENRKDKAAELVDAAPIALDEALAPDDVFPRRYVGQPVRVEGTWVPRTFYVEDKPGGTWVVSPVTMASGSAILVVRGATSRAQAPDPTLSAALTGWLQPGEATTGVRIVDFLERLDTDLYGGYVIVREPVEPGLTPVTPDQLPKPGAFTGIRNLLYGLEWWVFGAFALFLWWRWCRDEVGRVRSRTTEVEADDPEVPSQA